MFAVKYEDLSFQERYQLPRLEFYDLFKNADLGSVDTGEQFEYLKGYKELADRLTEVRADLAKANKAKWLYDRYKKADAAVEELYRNDEVWPFLESQNINVYQIPDRHFELVKEQCVLLNQLRVIEESDTGQSLASYLRRIGTIPESAPPMTSVLPQEPPLPKKDRFFSVVKTFVVLLFIVGAFYVGTEFRTQGMISESEASAKATAAEQSGYQKGFESGETSGYTSGYSAGYSAASKTDTSRPTVKYRGAADKQESTAPTYDTYRSKRVEAILNSTVYVTDTGSKYHSAGCSYLSQSCIEISYSDAIDRGYTACSRCNP